jgi:hypothetical protein
VSDPFPWEHVTRPRTFRSSDSQGIGEGTRRLKGQEESPCRTERREFENVCSMRELDLDQCVAGVVFLLFPTTRVMRT